MALKAQQVKVKYEAPANLVDQQVEYSLINFRQRKIMTLSSMHEEC